MGRRERLGVWAAALILFVVGGAFGGWWYVSEHLVGEAEAQVTSQGCGQSSNPCRSQTFQAASDGTASAPAWRFGSDTDTGIYQSGDNEIAMATGGTQNFKLTGSALTVGNGTIATPSATDDVLVVKTSQNAGNILFGVGNAVPTYASLLAGNQSTRAAGVFRFRYSTGEWEVTNANGSAVQISLDDDGTITSNAVSGDRGFRFSANGALLDLGTGASDHLKSDGTNIVAANTVQGEGSPAFYATGTGGVQIVGVATGSLPACGGGTSGLVHNDTTLNRVAHCDGSSYAYLGRTKTGNVLSSFATLCFTAGACAESANHTGGFVATSGHLVQKVACSWNTAGAVGGGSNTVTVEVWDQTAGSALCTATLSSPSCSTTNTVYSGDCSGTMTAGNLYTTRLGGGTLCGTNPGQVVCNVEFVP